MSNDERKNQFKEILVEIVELIDDKIGGPVMDLPIIDKLEKEIVEAIVDMIWLLPPIEYSHVDDLFPWSA